MKCPLCNVDLLMTDRQGIEIDYCPTCRGIWLDRGELDKLIEKSAVAEQSAPRQEYSQSPQNSHDEHDSHSQQFDRNGKPKKKERMGFLGDFLDF